MNNILVIGESCLDEFFYGSCSRLCPDVPAPVLDKKSVVTNGGMAMNVYNNILALGGKVDIITNNNWKDIKKTRVVEENSNYIFVRIDEKADIEKAKIDDIDFSKYDVVIISDYDKGFLSREDICAIASKSKISFLDTKKKIKPDFLCVSYLKINRKEYSDSKEFINADLENKIIETLGPMGCRHKEEIFPVEELEVRSVSGAGDSFIAGLAVKFAETGDIRESIKFANAVSSLVITKKGVGVVQREEVDRHYGQR